MKNFTGRGSFVILDAAIEILVMKPNGFEYLKKAFDENVLENAGLEQLRFYAMYEKIIENTVTGAFL